VIVGRSRSVPDENRSGATRNFVATRIGELLYFQLIKFLGVSPVWRFGWAASLAPWVGACEYYGGIIS
jgi:hypothetical protein